MADRTTKQGDTRQLIRADSNVRILIVVAIVLFITNIILVSALIHARKELATYRQMLQSTTEEAVLSSGSEKEMDKPATSKTTIEEPAKEQVTKTDSFMVDEILQDNIQRSISGADGSWDIWAESLAENTYAHVKQGSNTNTMISASLIKLFIMGAAFNEVNNNNVSDADIHQDVWNMITVSDNDAANRIIRKLGNGDAAVGIEKINQFIESIGCESSKLNRLMLEENGQENYTSAEDCATILRLIYSKKCVNEYYSEQMMECLKAQTINDRIPAGVPSGVKVAHKTGNLTNLCNADVAIIFDVSVDYILCVINNNSPDDSQTTRQIANISDSVYNYYKASK